MSPLDRLRGGIVVSCQPLPDEPDDPMRDPYVQSRVAASVVRAGAVGVRINGVEDIAAVRAVVDVPVIGLIKAGPGPVLITPTATDALAAAKAGASVVAVDATSRPRPDGAPLAATIDAIHTDTTALVMADVSTLGEGVAAAEAGADVIATTLSGYTGASPATDGPDIALVAALAARVPIPVVAEGRYRSAADISRALDSGAHAVVVGNAITSPLWLTRRLLTQVRDLHEASGASLPGFR